VDVKVEGGRLEEMLEYTGMEGPEGYNGSQVVIAPPSFEL